MALKTVVKQGLSKWGPLSTEMQKAIEVDQAALDGDGKPEYIDAAVSDAPATPSDPIPGPEDAPSAPERSTESWTVPGPIGTKDKQGDFYILSPTANYRTTLEVAKLAKANFKKGDTAVVEWEMKDGVKWVLSLDRKAAVEAGTF